MADENNNSTFSVGSTKSAVQAVEQRERANLFLSNNNFTNNQVNGQRISINNSVGISPPNKDHEVFVGKLPRDLFEDELLPFMQSVGTVYKIRLMMDFSGTTRGFGFVTYANPIGASHACKYLNQIPIRLGNPPIGVLPSFDNKKLYFGNLPQKITKELLMESLSKILEGVESVELPEISGKSDKRHAFVKFKSHDFATQARRILIPGTTKIFNRPVSIDWARPDAMPPTPSPSPPSSTILSPSPLVQTPPTEAPLIDFRSSILGDKAWKMLETPTCDPNKTVTVTNVNIDKVELPKLRMIFQFAGTLNLTHISAISFNTIKLEYSSIEQASFIVDLLTLCPNSFNNLALPGQHLKATKGRTIMNHMAEEQTPNLNLYYL